MEQILALFGSDWDDFITLLSNIEVLETLKVLLILVMATSEQVQYLSAGTNASGIGKFEYDVPTGYTALSTKGLNE